VTFHASLPGSAAVFLDADIGTSGCRTGAVSADGRTLAVAERAYPLSTPSPGWAEQAELAGLRTWDGRPPVVARTVCQEPGP
jgi:glycerol kinase